MNVIVVANRLPYEINQNEDVEKSVSGLVTALDPTLSDVFSTNHNVTWIGGLIDDDNFQKNKKRILLENEKILAVPIPKELDQKFKALCNETLWPVFHEQLTFAPKQDGNGSNVIVDLSTWKAYEDVNYETFAPEIINKVKDLAVTGQQKTLIWIHDFQLLLVPNKIRETVSASRIGFFLHIPFPDPTTFDKLPSQYGKTLLQGMLGSDVVGFHTKKYCDNFLECCDKLLDCHVDIDSREVRYCGRKVLVRVIPAGITYDSFSKKADGQLSQNCPESLQEILAKYEDKKIIVGVDRIDYTKGLPEKVKAYQAFLEKHSGFDGKVVYVQIAIPCRQELQTYQEFSKEVKDLVADTKRKLVDKDFKPSIEMIYDKFSHDDLAVLYRKSHVAWVTPLKDGLNLVAMEYVACQSRDRPGVLILSKFAGAAETMDQAVQVDPCEIADMVNGLHSALTMTPDERKERMAKLQETVQTQSAEQYRDDNIKALFEGLVA